MFTPKGKDPISIEDNSCWIYIFECCCKNSCIGQQYRNLRTRIKEHLPKCVKNYIKTGSEITNTATKNAMKRSFVEENLINSPNCEINYDKINWGFLESVLNCIKLDEKFFHLYTPKLNKHTVFDYRISLLN